MWTRAPAWKHTKHQIVKHIYRNYLNWLSVSVDGSDLIEEGGGEADAKLCGDDGKAPFCPPVLPEYSKQSI